MLSKNQIKFINSLSLKKYRDQSMVFIAEGDKLIRDLLYSSFKINSLYLTNKSKLTLHSAEVISDAEMKKISQLKTPSCSLGIFKIPSPKLNIQNLSDQLIVALDDIQDPGNMGTIIRIADWFGIKHIICSQHTVDCFNPKTIQATMGAITNVNIHYSHLEDILVEARKNNLPIYGTFLEGNNIYNEALTKNGIIVMGNEGKGISPVIEQLITHKLFIPSFNNSETSESLNVAIATSIVCSEFCRRLKFQ